MNLIIRYLPGKKQIPMASPEKKTVSISSRVAGFIGSKATRKKKLQAASMQVEFTLRDTLVMLCYLSRDPDPEISSQARKNLIPATRRWHSRPDRPELPEPILEVVTKVIERIGAKKESAAEAEDRDEVRGNIGLLGLGEIIQAVDHNNRTVSITLHFDQETAVVYTETGKVVGAVAGDTDGLDALYKAFGWQNARFTYTHAMPGPFDQRIQANTLNLVMDALEHVPDEDPFDDEASTSWTVEGDLNTMNLFEISEVFEMNSKQCVCRLARNTDQGVLYFNQGRIINATLGAMEGMDAACHLLAWPSARFSISRGGEEISEVIHVGMQNLIIEAMRLLDEGVTVTDEIASELALIDELFDGKDLVALPVLDKVRIVFGKDQRAREVLETDHHPLVRKAIKVKISKTVHRYLSVTTDHDLRLKAARGRVPLSTTEKLVLLSYLSHDESTEIRDQAKETLAQLDNPTFRKGLGSDLHPAVMDFLVRETIRDEAVLKVACQSENIQDDTALHILDHWKTRDILAGLAENKKLLERSPVVAAKLFEKVSDDPQLTERLEIFEQSMLGGLGDIKVEGPVSFIGLRGLIHAAAQGNRTGTILMEGLEASGRVFFQRGKLIGATFGSLEGTPAVEAIIRQTDLKFRYLLRSHFHVENVDTADAERLLSVPEAGPSVVEKGSTAAHFVTGSLHAMDVYEVLSALEGTPTPMRVSVMCEEGSGQIFRDATRILHCHVDGKEGPFTAMAALLSWNGNRFIVARETGEFESSLNKNLGDFITESLKQIPEEAAQTERPGELPEWELSEQEFESLYFKILEMGVAEKIKLAMLGTKEARSILVRDPIKMVAVAAVKSPKIQLPEIETIAKSRHVCDDVLRQIAITKQWMKSYNVKVNLVNNSKTPLPASMKILPHLREMDLRKLAKSRNVPSALRTQARRFAETKKFG